MCVSHMVALLVQSWLQTLLSTLSESYCLAAQYLNNLLPILVKPSTSGSQTLVRARHRLHMCNHLLGSWLATQGDVVDDQCRKEECVWAKLSAHTHREILPVAQHCPMVNICEEVLSSAQPSITALCSLKSQLKELREMFDLDPWLSMLLSQMKDLNMVFISQTKQNKKKRREKENKTLCHQCFLFTF